MYLATIHDSLVNMIKKNYAKLNLLSLTHYPIMVDVIKISFTLKIG